MSQLPTSDETFDEIIAQHPWRVQGFIAAFERASELARVGVLIRGLPDKYLSIFVPPILDYREWAWRRLIAMCLKREF